MSALKKIFAHKKLLIGGAILAGIIVLLFSTGVIETSFEISYQPDSSQRESQETKSVNTSSKKSVSTPTPTSAPKEMTFGGNGLPEFSIQIPVKWREAEETPSGIALLVGARVPELQDNDQDFFTNINIIISPHDFADVSIEEYPEIYKEALTVNYPGMTILNDSFSQIQGEDVYIVETEHRFNPGDDLLHQIQYVFFVDDAYVMGVTGTARSATWSKHKSIIAEIAQSIKRIE